MEISNGKFQLEFFVNMGLMFFLTHGGTVVCVSVNRIVRAGQEFQDDNSDKYCQSVFRREIY